VDVRTLIPAFALVSLIGCTTAPTRTPREYLDEQTAATITAVAEPWILVRDGSSGNERDFLNLYAIDVNRMGDHRQYLAVLQWFPSPQSPAVPPALEIHGEGAPIVLQATTEDARSLGLAQPLAPALMAESKWWYFPVDKSVLTSVAQKRNLRATFVADDKRVAYSIWRDGSAELSELTGVLP
jgi:hypothetical protein